ncbi:MAG: hypothetical protein VCA74_01675 [Deltaproteobacteria bacterium]
MIFWHLWRAGLLARVDREKLAFFFGAGGEKLALSRRWPLLTAINWPKALLWPAYARAVAGWLAYRVELYDGLQG